MTVPDACSAAEAVENAVRLYRQHVTDPACPLSRNARQLWINLAGWADQVDEPSMQTMCRAMGRGERTVKRARAELIAYGVRWPL
jgi:hypothetical protein